MKARKTLLLSSLLFVMITGCKKEDTTDENTPEGLLFKSFQVLEYASERTIEIGDSMNVDPRVALYHMVAELELHEDVEQVIFRDSTYLRITTTGDFITTLTLNEVDQDELSLYRGSGAGSLIKMSSGGSCQNEIPNKKVLLFAANHDDFYKGSEFQTRVVDVIESLDPEAEVTVLKEEQCNLEVMETFNQYGLVIIDAHGKPDGVHAGKLTFRRSEIPVTVDAFKNLLVNKLGTRYYSEFVNKNLRIDLQWIFKPELDNQTIWDQYKSRLTKDFHVVVTSAAIRNVLPDLNNTVLFANNCYSGYGDESWTYTSRRGRVYTYSYDGIGTAWLSKNPITLYAYQSADNITSYKADNDFCKQNEDTLIHSFFSDGDSTGIAHLKNGSTLSEYPWHRNIGSRFNHGPLVFKQFAQDNWCYQNCSDMMTDTRDGRVYPTVCIGRQTWFAENLKFAGAGICYDEDLQLCNDYGRLYTIAELTANQISTPSTVVQGLCPDGWHVPSKAEWEELFDAVGGIATAGPKLMTTTEWEQPNSFNDEYGFNLEASGAFYTSPSSAPNDFIQYALGGFGASFWTSSAGPNPNQFYSVDVDEYGQISFVANLADLVNDYYTGSTCRCLKD